MKTYNEAKIELISLSVADDILWTSEVGSFMDWDTDGENI